jgi:hypothetical protein
MGQPGILAIATTRRTVSMHVMLRAKAELLSNVISMCVLVNILIPEKEIHAFSLFLVL